MVDIDQGEVIATNTKTYAKAVGGRHFAPGSSQRVPLSFVSGYGMDTDLRFDFSPLAGHFRSRLPDGRIAIDFHCPMSMVDGYGRHALAIFYGLQGLGMEVGLRPSWIVNPDQWVSSELRQWSNHVRTMMPSKVAVAMTLPYDTCLYDNSSLTHIGITQFETDRVPEKHVAAINRLDHLIVTSSFQVPVMRKSGVKVPIDVLTAGIDTEYFAPYRRRRDGRFKVLILGALTGRKNPLGAIRIFQQASNGSPDWRLTIKSRRADGMDRVAVMARADRRIDVLIGDDPPGRVRDYYYAFDCLLWPSKGEGCGLPPLEAMATGMEVVCSYNSGMTDFIDEGWAYPIRTAGMERADGPGGFSQQYVDQFGDVGRWWVPDEGHAISQLRRCFNSWYKGDGKGAAAAEYVRAKHTLGHQARSVAKVVERYV